MFPTTKRLILCNKILPNKKIFRGLVDQIDLLVDNVDKQATEISDRSCISYLVFDQGQGLRMTGGDPQ